MVEFTIYKDLERVNANSLLIDSEKIVDKLFKICYNYINKKNRKERRI